MRDIELLQFIHETAAMGVKGLEDVKGHIYNSKLSEAVSQQVREYNKISKSSSSLLRSKGEEPKDPGLIAKISSEAMTAAKTMMDSSASKLQKWLSRGILWGLPRALNT